MKSATEYPEYQGDPNNIQFLSRDEHLEAHKGSWQNPTNWYYNPETKEFVDFGENKPIPCAAISLSKPIYSPVIKSQNKIDELDELHRAIWSIADELRGTVEYAMGSESEGDFVGLFAYFDVNSNKLGATMAKRNEHLARLLHGIADMNLGFMQKHDIDAYEYLMIMYASNAGKSGGKFFTPADASELLTRPGTVVRRRINKFYDSKVQTIIQLSDYFAA